MDHSRRSGRHAAEWGKTYLSLESISADRQAAEYCLKGVAEGLNASPRFTPVVIYGEAAGAGSMPYGGDLTWERVEAICRRYRLDALIVLDRFDSDIRLKSRTTRKKKKDGLRHHLSLTITVASGWRVYVPDSRRVVDAEIYRDRKSWTASGDTRREALRNLPDKRDALNKAGFFSGTRYAERISPTWVTLSRTYFSKGCPEFETAQRLVKTGNWDGAEELWRSVVDGGDAELAGKATWNLALAAEIKGNLEQAVQLARRAYTRFGLRKAFRYMQELQARIQERERLDRQLDGE